MTSIGHTYSQSCALQTESNTFTRRASMISEDPPRIRAQFFYNSLLAIDDPLSPIPSPSIHSNGSSKSLSRPFSVHDNTALEEAWRSLQIGEGQKNTHPDKAPRDDSSSVDRVSEPVKNAEEAQAAETAKQSNLEAQRHRSIAETTTSTGPVTPDTSDEHPQPAGNPHLMLCDDPAHVPFDETMPVGAEEIGNDEFEGGIPKKKHRSRFRGRDNPKNKGYATPSRSGSRHKQKLADGPIQVDGPYGSSPLERDTTGTPFLRVSNDKRLRSLSPTYALDGAYGDDADRAIGDESNKGSQPRDSSRETYLEYTSNQTDLDYSGETDRPLGGNPSRRKSKEHRQAAVPVGISRLHLVKMPELKMGPIYWDPVHDISSVVRGTWFYKATMNPVESDVANRLEEGYEYLKPWTPTYEDEVNSCLEVGAAAELKVVWKLWPDRQAHLEGIAQPAGSIPEDTIPVPEDEETNELVEQDLLHAVKVAGRPENRAAGNLDAGYTKPGDDSKDGTDTKDNPVRLYPISSIIYATARDAQILRPGQVPNVAYGRRPLGPIRKGRAIGIPVVRGFDYKVWEKLNPPPKKVVAANKARENAEGLRSATALSTDRRKSCGACLADEERPTPTDLVLVIHGIGQKLSERVESYHFTHAINAFRRQVNVELAADTVKPWLREDLGGIMVLPINWRSTLKLEDGGPDPNPNHKNENSSDNQFTLKDITADSIPAIRNLISDVMLDIPYYLSHHRTKMIEAVIKEANRVYRLWCNNNPGFAEAGRVHLLAHSLGSVMAMDILSKQPTKLPRNLDIKTEKLHSDMFEFDTKSVFFCGSPAGFFLLLNKSPLLPRRGRQKPGTDGEDAGSGVAGDVGTYGCLATDNLYNIMHYNDPVAYRMNACVDVRYAASLQTASVPSATSTWLQYFGLRRRSVATPKVIRSNTENFPERPKPVTMPSTVEMEVHNFSKEEIAEKRMFLLNDNGQIDFTLNSGGGPLEIKYLNMLSAHSSYWTLQDFVRFLVVEVGRKAGRDETMGAVKAVKRVRTKK